MIIRTCIVSLIFVFASKGVFAEVPVEVVSTSDDPVGSRLVYQIKEQIRTSSLLKQSLENEVRMQLNIVTLDPGDKGYTTAYSAVLVWNNPQQPFPFYLTQYVGYCGSSKVRECAESIVAGTAEQAENVIRLLKAIYKK